MNATHRNGGLYALLTEFESPSAFMHACEKVRDAGFRHWDELALPGPRDG